MEHRVRRASGMAGVAAAAILMIGGCASTPAAEETVPTPAGSEAPASPTPDPQESAPRESATEGFLAWLDSSRRPDAAKACAGLTPELAARMLTELNATSPVRAESCEQMITATAELYRALGQSAEVDVAVQRETDQDAVLFVTYADSGDCGTVTMSRPGTSWVITEQTQECGR
ncbi:hypothetical protein [Microbacterium sp.]|uniref:hypothetical protein n=1 Tax=Microbacterium sp. TaxID=51671 RepID=UPI00333EED0D